MAGKDVATPQVSELDRALVRMAKAEAELKEARKGLQAAQRAHLASLSQPPQLPF